MNLVFKLLKILNSDVRPWQISTGFVLGLAVGLSPLYALSNLALVFLLCFFRINIAAFLLSAGLFSGIAWVFDQQLLMIGESVLHDENLQSVWTTLYASELWRLTHFNHTLMMGAWVLSALLALPLFFTSQFLIVHYRETFMAWVQQTKLMQWVKMSKWYQRGAKAFDLVEEVVA